MIAMHLWTEPANEPRQDQTIEPHSEAETRHEEALRMAADTLERVAHELDEARAVIEESRNVIANVLGRWGRGGGRDGG